MKTQKIIGLLLGISTFGFISTIGINSVLGQSRSESKEIPQMSFTIRNYTGETIKALYLSPTEVDDWGNNDIINDIPPDGSITFYFEFDCYMYDIKVITTNNREIVKRDEINICDGSNEYNLY